VPPERSKLILPDTLSFLTEDEFPISKANLFDNGKLKNSEILPIISWENIFVAVNNSESNLSIETEIKECAKKELKAFIQKENRATSIPLYERCAEICNKSPSHVMQILPLSDLDIVTRWEPFDNVRSVEEQNDKLQHDYSPFKICGPLFELKPGDKARIYLSRPQPSSLTQEKLIMISNGKNVSVRGVFFLIDSIQNLVVKLVDLCSVYCVSRGELSVPIVNLGRI
ncbi:9796_t:CDS:1, partial [Racocetra persica]